MKDIIIRGAKVNNLKSIDLDLPINKLSCFFGPSGSGKSSIAFHTLFSESKRRFLNSFPTYLKFFSERPAPVDVDEIYPVLPVFGLPQVNPVVGTRSTVADIMHLTEMLQNHFFHFSQEFCPVHKTSFEDYFIEDFIKDKIESSEDGNLVFHVLLKAQDFIDYFRETPFPSRSLKSKRTKKITDFDKEHEFWEVSRFKLKNTKKLNEQLKPYIEKGLSLFLISENYKITEINFKKGQVRCPVDGCDEAAVANPSVMHFSPYNALGACSTCGGFGETLDYDEDKLVDKAKSIDDDGVLLLNYKRFTSSKSEFIKAVKKEKINTKLPIGELGEDFWDLLYNGAHNYSGFKAYFKYLERKKYKMNVRIFIRNIQKSILCHECHGSRMNTAVEKFYLDKEKQITITKLNTLTINEILNTWMGLEKKHLIQNEKSQKSYKRILNILDQATKIGLGHLQLYRKAKTLSAGEYQRLLLLKYLSYEGSNSLFVFDEPSLGLSIKEQSALLKGFRNLIDMGNTVVLVDHSKYFQKESDYLVEMGPGSGSVGGELLYAGESKGYKFKKIKHNLAPNGLEKKQAWIEVFGPKVFNKTYNDFKIAYDKVNLIQGSSGSGKSASIVNTLAADLHYRIYDEHMNIVRGEAQKIKLGCKNISDVIVVDANLNRYSSRSSVGSMTGLFGVMRKHFSLIPASKAMGLKEGHFSYHSDLGQCPKCEGKGVEIVEMQFLEDIVLTCEDCKGQRLKPLYASISDGSKTVHEAYSMPIKDAFKDVKLTPKFQRIFEYMKILNLDYLSLNRSVNSLSGGEKQRLYLLNKLQKNLKDAVIVFENISFGLSDHELIRVSELLQKLSHMGNTIVVIDQENFFENIADHIENFTK